MIGSKDSSTIGPSYQGIISHYPLICTSKFKGFWKSLRKYDFGIEAKKMVKVSILIIVEALAEDLLSYYSGSPCGSTV